MFELFLPQRFGAEAKKRVVKAGSRLPKNAEKTRNFAAMNQDTICALATANGIGAIGIIRVSGEHSFEIVNRIFEGKDLTKVKSHTVHYGFIVETEMRDVRHETRNSKTENQEQSKKGQVDETVIASEAKPSQVREKSITNGLLHSDCNDSEIIDEVMVSVFKAPKTFTTENSVEISFHGSPFIAKRILEVLIKNGARMAKAGEFTMRAFMNGRIDLSQAESIADLIASENEASRKVALNQLKGGISREILVLRGDLLNFTSLIELELDFAEEDVEFADRSALKNLLSKLKSKISDLISSFQYGNAIKNGIDVAIIGKPNAGKSTLLNALLKEDRAIVSDIAGTTRDTIEEVLHIQGNAFRFIDTAGIRDTTDTIEAIGVKKAKEKIGTAKILLYLYDEWDSQPDEVIDFVKEFYRKDLKIILLHNKTDLTDFRINNAFDEELKMVLFPYFAQSIIPISARDGKGIPELISELTSYLERLKGEEHNTVITNQRHYEALQKSLDSITKVEEAVNSNITTELLSYELRNALENLGEISGEFTNDEVLGNIFSKFCIGK